MYYDMYCTLHMITCNVVLVVHVYVVLRVHVHVMYSLWIEPITCTLYND